MLLTEIGITCPRQCDVTIAAGEITGTESRRTTMAGDPSKYLGNRVFPSVEDLDEAVAKAWLEVIKDANAIRSLCGYKWITQIGQNKRELI
jgi:hypothetical protein